MTFPTIHHINDVLPHIDGRDEFIVAERDGYMVIDYNFALPDSFYDPVRLECRGIKFATDGRVIARPLHKFFNIGERPETQADALPFGGRLEITEKLDGSMIHAAVVHGEVVLMTRMGRTDVAIKAERHLTSTLRAYCYEAMEHGCTPIFEFTAPDNRIVIKYEDSSLSLLTIRRMHSGEYLDSDRCRGWARDAGIQPVAHFGNAWRTGAAFAEYARTVTGREGYVVRFAGGLWIKAKGADYVLKHRAKDSVLQEKNVLALVLTGGLDDVLPLLDADDRARVEKYRDEVVLGMWGFGTMVNDFVASNDNLDQKAFAFEVMTAPAHVRPIAFQVRQGKPANDVIRTAVLKKTGSQADVDAARAMHGAVWDAA